ncbi:MAG: rRNA (cytosine1402-N4)-methyltransferase [Clostridiales bacterium]|nr:rRNA (cytosine1402-N4)-methyltransferase [Clostridiales bacterium]MDN5281815.1 rRNA (cytosine1402-N4)-methyltransferase [Candidatus Ozemobacter sp.]
MNKVIPQHQSVLMNAVLNNAFPENGKIFVDATFGLGGHTRAILEKFPGITKVIAIDRDAEILDYSCKILKDDRIMRFQANASDLPGIMPLAEVKAVDGILLDLGVSSYQLDNPQRGFSFSKPGPLDMRMDKDNPQTAADLVNSLEKAELVNIFKKYGEEKFSGRIADAIIKERQTEPFSTTDRLAKVISEAIPAKFRAKSQIHPATRVFQALRIAVNDELGELENFLSIALDCLNPGGHLCIISFHSLEDRIVKNFMQKLHKGCTCPPSFPVCNCGNKPQLRILTRKAIFAEEEEIRHNPRARSARLRAARKCFVGEHE